MRCVFVPTSLESLCGLFRLTGFERAGLDHFAISLFASRLAEPHRISSSLSCDCGNRQGRFPSLVSPDVNCRSGLRRNDRERSRQDPLLASNAHATRAILLASATAATLVWTREAS